MSLARSFLLFTLALTPFTSALPFNLTASLPGSTLDGQTINAAGSAFYLGLANPGFFCPDDPGVICPNTTQTLIVGMTAMWVEVPGGQQIYITPAGALGFTQAHSTSIPPGSFQGGFTNVTVESDCAPDVTVFNWASPDGSTGGIYACPPSIETTATFQIFAKTPAFNQTNCVELDGMLPNEQTTNDFGAWQYI